MARIDDVLIPMQGPAKTELAMSAPGRFRVNQPAYTIHGYRNAAGEWVITACAYGSRQPIFSAVWGRGEQKATIMRAWGLRLNRGGRKTRSESPATHVVSLRLTDGELALLKRVGLPGERIGDTIRRIVMTP